MVIKTIHDIQSKGSLMGFGSVDVKPVDGEDSAIISVQCKKNQKWKQRKYDRFYKWLNKNKPVTSRYIFKKSIFDSTTTSNNLKK